MNNNPFKLIVIWIIFGAIIGSLIGIFGLLGVIPRAFYESAVPVIIKVCIGIIIAIIDLLFIWALLKPLLDNYIDKNGESTTGIVDNVREIPRPNQLYADEWLRKLRYSCTVSYKVGINEYRKEFPPTFLTSKRELYPLSIETGNKIHIKYLKKIPSFSILDVEQLKLGRKAEFSNDKIYFIVIPSIITAMYVISLIFI